MPGILPHTQKIHRQMLSDHLAPLSMGLPAFLTHFPSHSHMVICGNCSLWGDPERRKEQSDESNGTTAGTIQTLILLAKCAYPLQDIIHGR